MSDTKKTPKESIISEEGKILRVPYSHIGVWVRPDKRVSVVVEVNDELTHPTGLFERDDQLDLMNMLSHVMEEKYEDL